MGDEPAYPRWGYCFHAGCWAGAEWYCQEEGCRYCGWPVPVEVAGLQADDATGYNGDYLNAGSVAGGENDWNNATVGYGGGRQGDYQSGNQVGQDLYQDGVQQPETYWHNANEQYNDQEYDGQYGDQYNDDQQNDTDLHDADRSGDYHQNDHQPPNSPSEAWATMGSRSSAGQTNSVASTETLDIDAISMAGNADRDRARWFEEQTAIRTDTWSDQDIVIQAVGQFANSPPGYRYGDTPYQGELYPHELSLSDGSESSVGQSNVERPVPGRR
ncbi:Hypothetical protein NCS54_00282000 [Fusarium falciforme]|uniref:Hypothetical protein n=1 Tax=Fusarium falciforme TaxID=195108 RepID=UPI0023017152|nr:Hypothetical protein NCS54_00282000 [Fusarium falciforme]WAO85575.1 Hypothetical protein NCS54_00282000 [Fusarium falciforme]